MEQSARSAAANWCFFPSLCLKAEAAFINYWFTECSRVGTQSENNERPKESGEI